MDERKPLNKALTKAHLNWENNIGAHRNRSPRTINHGGSGWRGHSYELISRPFSMWLTTFTGQLSSTFKLNHFISRWPSSSTTPTKVGGQEFGQALRGRAWPYISIELIICVVSHS
ncbi:Uncharacterized protein Fot_52006 [Forsythia ovata]|uniref:Uncharacterized protein n=1 Tax=Forsythia ovata TaxID=205694 RepID=A0ABD1PJH0_9LAMI